MVHDAIAERRSGNQAPLRLVNPEMGVRPGPVRFGQEVMKSNVRVKIGISA